VKKLTLSITIFLASVLFLTGCGSKLAFDIPEQRIRQGDDLAIELKKYVGGSEDSEVFFSLLSGVGRVVGSRYELEADASTVGSNQVSIAAFAKGSDPITSSFEVIVEAKNFPPEGGISDLDLVEGDSVSLPLDLLILDPEGSNLTYELSGDFREGFARIRGTIMNIDAKYADGGTNLITVTARDEFGNSRSFPFAVNVMTTNNPPVVQIVDQSVQEHRVLSLDLKQFAYDPDGDGISFELADESVGEINSGIFTYESEAFQEKPISVSFRALDSKGAASVGNFSIAVVKTPDRAEGVLTVGKLNGEYESIQAAIDAAQSGDTVKILPGEYRENITIGKDIILMGTSKDEVLIKASSIETPAIFIRGVTNFVIDGISLESGGSAINVSRSSGEIVNSNIAGGRFAISFSGDGKNLTVSNCYITSLMGVDNEEYLSTRLVGIYAYGEANLVIRNSVFERTGTGVSFSNGLNYLVKNCEFRRNSVGVSLNSTSIGSLVENRITENVDNGILINITSTATLTDNLFYENSRHGLDLYLKSCTDCGCGGTTFKGTVLGSGNVFDSEEEICPLDYWDDTFYSFDETLGTDSD